MESITAFLEGKLKLKVNRMKSAVARPWERKFLGFSFTNGRTPKRRVAAKALLRFETRIRIITRRTRGLGLEAIVRQLGRYLRGWQAYFGFCQTPTVLLRLNKWIRRRLRSLQPQPRRGHAARRFSQAARRIRRQACRRRAHPRGGTLGACMQATRATFALRVPRGAKVRTVTARQGKRRVRVTGVRRTRHSVRVTVATRHLRAGKLRFRVRFASGRSKTTTQPFRTCPSH